MLLTAFQLSHGSYSNRRADRDASSYENGEATGNRVEVFDYQGSPRFRVTHRFLG